MMVSTQIIVCTEILGNQAVRGRISGLIESLDVYRGITEFYVLTNQQGNETLAI